LSILQDNVIKSVEKVRGYCTGIVLEQCLAVRTALLGEEQHLGSFEHLYLGEWVREVLQSAGEAPTLLPVQVDATFYRWLVQEATVVAYHDMFLYIATLVLLTAIPTLWLRSPGSSRSKR